MTPFQGFRVWFRRAPVGERLVAGLAAVLILAVVTWLLVPTSTHTTLARSGDFPSGSQGSYTAGAVKQAGGPGTGIVGSGTLGANGGAAGAGGVVSSATASPTGGETGSAGAGASRTGSATGSAPTSGQATTRGPGGCVSPPGSDQGVTSTEIKIAIFLLNVVGPTGNAAFDIPSPQQQQDDFQIVINSVNAAGGVACRHIVPMYLTANPVDQSDLEQKCLDAAQAGVFFAIDGNSAYLVGASATCFPQNHLPVYESSGQPRTQLSQFYPYLFSVSAYDVLYRNTVFALNQNGFFSPAKGFRKLGYLYTDCVPQYSGEMEGWLAQAGAARSQIVPFDVGCPTGFASPAVLEQAVLTFQRDGVTHVTETQFGGDWNNFTTIAEQQGFHPRYGMPDDDIQAGSYGAQHPDFNNANQSVVITNYRFGEDHTPGYVPSTGTQECNRLGAAHGMPPIYGQQNGELGVACSEMWEFAALVDHAPELQRTALAAGLEAAGTVDFAFPFGPATFAGSGVTYGGNFWRSAEFHASCRCWQLLDPTFHPSF